MKYSGHLCYLLKTKSALKDNNFNFLDFFFCDNFVAKFQVWHRPDLAEPFKFKGRWSEENNMSQSSEEVHLELAVILPLFKSIYNQNWNLNVLNH